MTNKNQLKVGDIIYLSRNKITGDRSFCEDEFEITKLSKNNTHADVLKTKTGGYTYSVFLEEYEVYKQDISQLLSNLKVGDTVTFKDTGKAEVHSITHTPNFCNVLFVEDTNDPVIYNYDGTPQSDHSLLTIVLIKPTIDWDTLPQGTLLNVKGVTNTWYYIAEDFTNKDRILITENTININMFSLGIINKSDITLKLKL